MWCLRGYYFKMAPGTVKKAIIAKYFLERFLFIRDKKMT